MVGDLRDPWAALRARPLVCSCAGAVALGFSAIVYRLAEATPVTGAFFRFALSLPVLALLAWCERGRERSVGPHVVPAGILLAVDMILWHAAVDDVGAGLGTVLANTQVIFMVAIAWAVLDERLRVHVAIGITLAITGVVLISGVLEEAPYGGHPVRGTVLGVAAGLTSALYILALRRANLDRRRPVTPLFVATAIGTASAGGIGALAAPPMDLTPPVESLVWLLVLALTSQVFGWLLLSVPLRTLRATTTSVVLNAQPVAALLFAAVILAEAPSLLQLGGGVLTLAGLLAATAGGRSSAGAAPTPAGPTRSSGGSPGGCRRRCA